MKRQYDPALLDAGLKSLVDLRNDLAVQAARDLDAKIIAAVEAAFNDGMDFVRDCDVTVESPDPFAIRDIFAPLVHTVSYRGGPVAPDRDTPAGMVRYTRPADWRPGQRLRP